MLKEENEVKQMMQEPLIDPNEKIQIFKKQGA